MGNVVPRYTDALPVIAVDISGNAANFISNSGAQGDFVNVTGDQMTGDLIMSANIEPLTDITQSLGSPTKIFLNANIRDINNLALITGNGLEIKEDAANFTIPAGALNQFNVIKDGESFTAISVQDDLTNLGSETINFAHPSVILRPLLVSGLTQIGIPAVPWSGLAVENITLTTTLKSGVSILNAISGVNDLGSLSNPFANVFADNLVTNGGLQAFQFFADQFDNPNTSDWDVNALAPGAADTNNSALTVRLFDDTAEEGVGWTLKIPTGKTSMTFTFQTRAESTPAGAVTGVMTVREREIPDNGAVTAWSSGINLAGLAYTTNEFFQTDMETLSFSTLGLTAGSTHQFELTRDTADAGDNLTGDLAMYLMQIEFV